MSTTLALLRRDWAIERTYHFQLLLSFIQTAGLALGIYFISKLVENPSALADYEGTYFDFVMVGLAVNSFAGVGLQSFGTSLIREQSTGTIELLLASPASPGSLMGGMFLFPFALGTLEIVGLVGVGVGLVGSGIPIGGLLLAVPVLLLTTATFAAVGIAAAGVLILVKRGDPLTGPFFQVSMLLSGAIFPLEVLPGWLQALSVVVPATYGVEAVRELLLADAGWRDVATETAALAGFTAVMVPVALLLLRRALALGRRDGLLGGY